MLQQQQQSEERVSGEENQNRSDNRHEVAEIQEGVGELDIGEGQQQELRIAHNGAQNQEGGQSAEEQQQEREQGQDGDEQPQEEEQLQVNENGLQEEQQQQVGQQLQGGGGQQQEEGQDQDHEDQEQAQQEALGQSVLKQEPVANEKEEFLQSLSMSELTECKPEEYGKVKDFLLKSDERQLRRLGSVSCHRDPVWVLSLLQKHAMYLRVLKLRQVRSEHLLATMRMPKLQELTLHSCDGQDPIWTDPSNLPLDLPVGSGLRKLTLSGIPWPTVVALLTAHRLTLQELKLRPMGADEDSQILHSVPLLVTLPRLRKITLNPLDDFDLSEDIKALIHQNNMDLLTAARLSSEELDLWDMRSEVVQVTQGMPRLRKLKLQGYLVNNVEGLLLSASGENAGDAGLRVFEALYVSWDSLGRVTQDILVANSRTLEEVNILNHVERDHLLSMQRMPRLRKLSLHSCFNALNDNPTIPELADACRNVQSLVALSLPTTTVLSLLSLYSESLEELELHYITEEQLLAVSGLPNLRRLKLDGTEWNSDETTVVVPETHFVRLERLQAASLPEATLLSVLVAGRATLQEVVLGSDVLLEQLLELQRMPALRTLRLHSCHEDVILEDPGLPKELPEGATGLRVLGVRSEMPRQTLFSLLVSHSRTLEELDLEGPAREHLLATLRMPELRRLCLRGSRRDLREVPQLPMVDVGEGVTVLRLSELGRANLPLLPMETIRCLLTAHRHSIRHLELDVGNERDEDNRDASNPWPAAWSGLHRVLQQCALERLEVVSLNRSSFLPTFPGSLCREQQAALLRVLPGTEVRCSVCHFRKGHKIPFDRD